MGTMCSIKKQINTRQEGFAILEGLIAMTIFTIGILAVCGMQTKAVDTNDLARGVSEQSILAEDIIEQLVPLPYDDPDDPNDPLEPGNYLLPDEGRYTRSYEVVPNDFAKYTKTITVTISWIDRGMQKSINLVYIKPLLG
jgi:hypothetical protein